MRRFTARAVSVSRRSGVPSRKASMPPLRSTVRIARVESRSRTSEPRISESSELSWRLGRKRRRVLLLAWLTLLPVSTPLPVISQRRDIAVNLDPNGRGALWPNGPGASSAVVTMQFPRTHAGHGIVQDLDDRLIGDATRQQRQCAAQ